ncbi:HV320 protein, partial [Polypterus senegalus]
MPCRCPWGNPSPSMLPSIISGEPLVRIDHLPLSLHYPPFSSVSFLPTPAPLLEGGNPFHNYPEGIQVLFPTTLSGVAEVSDICCGVTLTPSSSSETVRPGSSLTLTCQISGYSLTDCDYATDWIRQLPENALEWLSLINCHGSAGYASSVQGRFTMTRSSSSVSLEMRSMKAADSAIYYCARHPQCGGTCGSVTLTPSSFSEAVRSGSSLTLTCQVSGYSLTDSSYYTNWIRQLPQRTLEWLGYINAVGSTSYASSVQGRFTITKSSSSLSLEMRSLTEADSAVYYCARGTQ